MGPPGAPDGDRRARLRRRGRQHEHRGGDQRRGVPGVHRAGADPGPARPIGRPRGDGQPAGPQGRAGPRRPRGGRDLLPLSAVLLARPEPDRAVLVEAQGLVAGQGGADPGGARGRARPGAGHHHRPGRPGLVPPLWLQTSQLTCGWLMTMAEEVEASGLLDLAAERHARVVAFDRPGYGYSERPRDRVWTPAAQADLVHRALVRLGAERAVVVGHSLGTVVALELALRHPSSVAALALLSGYYFPTARVDAPVQALPAVPVLGDIMRYTISPLMLRLAWPGLMRVLFGPAPTPPAFDALKWLVARPEQIRASASESALLVPTVASLQQHYTELKVPVVIAAGAEGRYIDTEAQSARLHHMLPESGYRVVPGAGHMMHHTAPDEAMAAIDLVAGR